MFSANLGSDFKPIKKVASGERCQGLCFRSKQSYPNSNNYPALFLMKLTQGSPGPVSNEIANIMAYMSENMQVFTITHLHKWPPRENNTFCIQRGKGNTTMTKLRVKSRGKNKRIGPNAIRRGIDANCFGSCQTITQLTVSLQFNSIIHVS